MSDEKITSGQQILARARQQKYERELLSVLHWLRNNGFDAAADSIEGAVALKLNEWKEKLSGTN